MKTSLLLLSLAAMALAGCAKPVTWKEEVQLSDGRVIVVERETVRAMGGPGLADGGSGSRPKERRIRFEFPLDSGQQVEWRSSKMSPSLVPEIPLVMDIRQGTPILFSIVAVSAGCETYAKYIYRDGDWLEETLPEEFEKVATNLFLKSGPSMPSFVALAEKQVANSDIRYYKTLKQVGPHRVFCGG